MLAAARASRVLPTLPRLGGPTTTTIKSANLHTTLPLPQFDDASNNNAVAAPRPATGGVRIIRSVSLDPTSQSAPRGNFRPRSWQNEGEQQQRGEGYAQRGYGAGAQNGGIVRRYGMGGGGGGGGAGGGAGYPPYQQQQQRPPQWQQRTQMEQYQSQGQYQQPQQQQNQPYPFPERLPGFAQRQPAYAPQPQPQPQQEQAPPQYQQQAPPSYQQQAPPSYQQQAPSSYQQQAPPYQQQAPSSYQQRAPSTYPPSRYLSPRLNQAFSLPEQSQQEFQQQQSEQQQAQQQHYQHQQPRPQQQQQQYTQFQQAQQQLMQQGFNAVPGLNIPQYRPQQKRFNENNSYNAGAPHTSNANTFENVPAQSPLNHPFPSSMATQSPPPEQFREAGTSSWNQISAPRPYPSGSTFAQRLAQRRAGGGQPTGTGAGARKPRRGRDLSETGGTQVSRFTDRRAAGLPPPPEMKSLTYTPAKMTPEVLYPEVPAVINTPLGQAKTVITALPQKPATTPSRKWGPEQWETYDRKLVGVAKKVVEGRLHEGERTGKALAKTGVEIVVRGGLEEAGRYIGRNQSYAVKDKRKFMTPLWSVLAPKPVPAAELKA